jgi:MFS family permease
MKRVKRVTEEEIKFENYENDFPQLNTPKMIFLLFLCVVAGMTISMLILAIYSSSYSQYLPYGSWISTFCLLAYIMTSTFGFLTIPFTMLPELFPQRVRGITAGMTVCVAYFMSFIAIKSYPSLLLLIGNDMIFLLYAIVSLLGTLFVHFVLPETKGKTLQEIENLFKRQPSNSAERI